MLSLNIYSRPDSKYDRCDKCYKSESDKESLRDNIGLNFHRKSIRVELNMEKSTVQGRQVIWVFPGMSQEWPQMGKALMEVPAFKDTIKRCHTILQDKDKSINLIKVLTTDDSTVLQDIVNTFIGITAVQLGLINIMQKLDLQPDYIIGYSLGEIACAYADHCLTEKQALLASYYRGLVTRDGNVEGVMAIVFMSAVELDKILPEDVENGCHITPNMCTITGKKHAVEKFLSNFDKNSNNKIMKTSKTPFHSSHIKHLGIKLEEYLKEVILNPTFRSNKWYSTVFPYEIWNKEEPRFCSPKYFVDNFTGVSYFEEACKLLPSNSIIIDLSPSGIMTSVAQHNFKDSVCIPLTKKYDLNGMRILVTNLKQ